jgi:chromosome segregation protein
LKAVEQLRKEGYGRLAKISELVDEQRRQLDQARGQVAELELALQKLGMEEQHIKERVIAEYGEELLQVITVDSNASDDDYSSLEPQARNEQMQELNALKARMLREGEVDMMAIEEYEREKARLDDLENQKRDLDQAATILKKTIDKLTETSQQRFVQTFEAVSRNFSELVPRLYGGGKGSLELTDPTKPLESGVDIVIRPPGKKLKSIELLSGGEKALAAVALILGMFMERPSPVCVLDEVDAPLDDANLVRFLSLIKEMSTRTQFLMITHNKQTMSAASKLIGITMEEPGATKIVTVSLEEAVQQVA